MQYVAVQCSDSDSDSALTVTVHCQLKCSESNSAVTLRVLIKKQPNDSAVDGKISDSTTPVYLTVTVKHSEKHSESTVRAG